MSTNYINTTEDTETLECEGEKVVTMMDVLQEQEEFEEDANAVLGASDDKNCTYSKGYIKRQAVYACLTCCSDAKDDPTKRAGVCLACSLNCHENHELIELYTRRNFRCDCGNPKFNSHPCQFTPNKSELNEDNRYNQNFIGIYCTCHRPYPDPDAVFEDEMIQCTICEDWLHASHLEATLPSNDQYSEMICKACMKMNEFLHDYSYWAVNVDVEDIDITVKETVEPVKEKKETSPNDSHELLSTSHETSEGDSNNRNVEISDKNEVLKYKISSITSNNIEQESIDFINGTNINRTIIETNGDNETDKEMLEMEKISNSREVDLKAGDNTIIEKSDELEENILNTNKVVTVNDALNASDTHNMSMETDDSQESQQRHTNNIQNGCISMYTTGSEATIINTSKENDSITESDKLNSDGNVKEGSNTNKIMELLSSNENNAVLEDEKIIENRTIEHATASQFHFDKSNSKCADQDFNMTEENEGLLPKTDQKDPIQSTDICSETDIVPKDLDNNEPSVEIEDQSAKKIDKESDKKNPIQLGSEVDNTLKDLETNQVETRNENHFVGEIEDGTEEILLQSTEINSEVNTELNYMENSKLVDKTEEYSTEATHNNTIEMDISETTSVNTNLAITSNYLQGSETESKSEEQSTERINKDTDQNDISNCTKPESNLDSILNNLEDSEINNECEEQFTEAINQETENNDISKTTEVDIKVDDTTLNMLEDRELETKTENENTETMEEESDEQDISKRTEVNTKIDDTLKNLEDSYLGNKIADQSTDKGTDKEDILESISVQININTTLNNLEGNNTETQSKEEEDTEETDVNIPEEGVDQSDTLEKATRELLELTSDMVEESEEKLLKSSDADDTNKECNGDKGLPETCNPTETDKKDMDIDVHKFETEESVNNVSQVEEPSNNNAQTKNENKRKYCEENEDLEIKKAKFEENKCIRPKGVQKIFKGATFWPSDFRQKLCTCNECLTMYKDLRLLFLLDPEDTVTAYETLGKEKIDGTPTTQYEKGLQALSSLDRVQQINALTEYNIMRDKLLDFLKSFKERKEIVKEEDIRAFFAGMKPRREPDGVYFCR